MPVTTTVSIASCAEAGTLTRSSDVAIAANDTPFFRLNVNALRIFHPPCGWSIVNSRPIIVIDFGLL